MSNDIDNIATLTDFDDHNVDTFSGERRAKKAPYRFRIGESPVFQVEAPDADAVLDIEEAKTSRRVLKLFLGDQYDDVEDYLGPQDPDTLIDVIRAMSRHFGLFDADAALNRAEKRSRSRRRGGGGRR
ncbi:hypothetical protein ABH922_002797 [Rhodococcus sp. 27YEA15]|uniref:hypothetical protein n=1 Tax=Rhodococcus sp. 27YEA15 TaxID=3156259 RepID=UPI003C7DB8ED